MLTSQMVRWFSKNSIWLRDGWVVAAILTISLLATTAGYFYEHDQARKRTQLIFDDRSHILLKNLTSTMETYGHVLRSGAALFATNKTVTRDEWQTYVEYLHLPENYPGIQGLSYNAIIRSPEAIVEFESTVQSSGVADFKVNPITDHKLHVPVLFLEPLTPRNRRAIGFNIYSESKRREAVDRALRTGKASVTEKITLVQEDQNGGADQIQSGVLVIYPVLADKLDPSKGQLRVDAAEGVIVSVFRMGDLVNSILSKSDDGMSDFVQLRLYDSATNEPEALFYETENWDFNSNFVTLSTFEIFGRQWTFQSSSTPKFDAETREYTMDILLFSGVLISLLLTSLAWGLLVRNRETLRTAALIEEHSSKVTVLMSEVNHRSKNLLSLVQAIARQTNKTGKHDDFIGSFSQRLTALAASHELLAKSEWTQISLEPLLRSQLAHFQDLIGERISITGVPVHLSPETAQTMGMAIHELATNASKYGALSNDVGTIEIKWNFDHKNPEAETFHLSWVERNGPKVEQPTSKGFGSKVTGTMVKFALSGEIETQFDDKGFSWALKCPARKIRYKRKKPLVDNINV